MSEKIEPPPPPRRAEYVTTPRKRKDDSYKEWVSMPEFIQEKQEAFAKIIVRFRNQADLDEFSRRIGQRLKANSQSTWYPELVNDDTVLFRWLDEP